MARGPIFRSRLDRAAQDRRRAMLNDLDELFLDQQARILARFVGEDEERLARRWADGQWTGRSGLELQEVRK